MRKRILFLILLSLIIVYFLSQFISDKLLVKNKFNGCIDCHGEMDGFESAHLPDKIGCEACHLGNSFTSNQEFAHKGMILIPGNLLDAEKTCGVVGCHPGIPQRINNSLMNTMSGVISVDRFAFDELEKPKGLFRVNELTQSDADNHLRNLCVSCHLGNEKNELAGIVRDFKKFTSKAIIRNIQFDTESRKEWMLEYFRKSGKVRSGIIGFKLWQDGIHAEEITSNRFFDEKLDYVHNNPVKELIVELPEDYLFSSARNYAGLKNYLEITIESVKQERRRL